MRKVMAKENSHIFHSAEGYLYRHSSEKIGIVLTRDHPQDKYGTPACPLIMSAYAFEQKRKGYSASFNFYYVGQDNYLNVANHFVIEKGKFLAQQFGLDLDIKNVYLFKDSIMKNF